MDTILITGGAGFVGRALAEHLLENYKVIVIDDLSSGYEKFLNKKVIFFKGSINDEMILNFNDLKVKSGLPSSSSEEGGTLFCTALTSVRSRTLFVGLLAT